MRKEIKREKKYNLREHHEMKENRESVANKENWGKRMKTVINEKKVGEGERMS